MGTLAHLSRSIFVGLAVSFLSGPAFAEDTPCSSSPETCHEKDALWAALESHNQMEFQRAFKALKKTDRPKLYAAIRALSFENTAEDEARAVMVASVMANERRKSSPSTREFRYWKNWFETSDPASPAYLIPAYMLFDLHGKLAIRLKRSKKNISDYKNWLAFTLENPEGRPEYLSEENLTRRIQEEQARLASLPALLQHTTNFLIANENGTLANYFQIFDTLNQNTKNPTYPRRTLPFSDVLDTAIQTPDLWAGKFLSYMACRPDVTEVALINKLIELDPRNTELQLGLIERLKERDDLPYLMQTLAFIISSETLLADPYIRAAVTEIDNNNPFTSVRAARQFALSPDLPTSIETLNENRSYCDAENIIDFAYVENRFEQNARSPDFISDLTSEIFRMGPPVMTVKTPSGVLTGHDRGEFGGGLLYFADDKTEPEILHQLNMIAIIESEAPGVYWGVSGLNHMIPGKGTIQRIDARTDDITVTPHKRMPIVTNNLKLLESGDLFMDFWTRSYTSYQDGVKTVTPISKTKSNPPVILTRSGELISACRD